MFIYCHKMVQTNGRTNKQFKIFAVTYSIGKSQNILIHVPTFFASDRPWFQLDCWILQFYSIVAEQAVNNQSCCNQLKCFVDWTATFYFSCIWFHPAPDISNDINFHFRRWIIEFKYNYKISLSRSLKNQVLMDTQSEKPWRGPSVACILTVN